MGSESGECRLRVRIMSFTGYIEVLAPWLVCGWAAYTIGGIPHAPKLTLRFRTLGTFSPTRRPERADGLPGFLFDLPDDLRYLGWSKFIDEFECVEAEFGGEDGPQHWQLPILKDALVHAAANSSAPKDF